MPCGKSETDKIFENIIFLADVFGEATEKDFPPLPVLEMARCFELAMVPMIRRAQVRRRDWPLWN